jgi:hypothetical protein
LLGIFCHPVGNNFHLTNLVVKELFSSYRCCDAWCLFFQVIDYCTMPLGNSIAEGRRELIRNMWKERIKGAKQNVEVVALAYL